MTETSLQTDMTDLLTLRFTLPDPSPETPLSAELRSLGQKVQRSDPRYTNLFAFSQMFGQVRSVVALGAYAGVLQTPSYGVRLGGTGSFERKMLAFTGVIADEFAVDRLTYQSPIDIYLVAAVVSGSVTAASLAAWKVVDLWEKVSAARIKQYEANMKRDDMELHSTATILLRSELNRIIAQRDEIDPGAERDEAVLERERKLIYDAVPILMGALNITVDEA